MSTFTVEQRSATVRAERIPERFDLSATQTLHFPEGLLDDVKQHADTIERSVGWCLWMAWCIATIGHRDDPIDEVGEERMPNGPKVASDVMMPLGTWRHVTRESERLDRSKSWLLARAWVAARERFVEAIVDRH